MKQSRNSIRAIFSWLSYKQNQSNFKITSDPWQQMELMQSTNQSSKQKRAISATSGFGFAHKLIIMN